MSHKFTLYPAIDLKDGNCVRLIKGDMSAATIFNDSPADQARQFADMGFDYLHLVDLNGAFAGEPVNESAVEQILKTVSMPVQLGGGIRELATIERWLSLGISRVILGTVAVKNPALVIEACKKFPNQVVVGLDARNGYIATEGWAEQSELHMFDMAARFEDVGVAAIIYTDIARDGILTGVNVKQTRALAHKTTIPVIASGGLASIDDVKTLLEDENSLISGAISGRALYDKRLDPAEAIKIISAANQLRKAI
ncbi:MAG: 1-(5-phosphoribosyl)-5-[(5-phosphoribosylamino)methylideneamino]imidazole-4-carboxamide isomerase [Rhizobiales bacterium]|nr:1-(5-phosphoribosyl)-5-[(5-phosphoribosylamino)methylideneamino]imidazole-4-carboxamide isomerase [Hyphomicrobiales bacterium]NRB15212.1 1-(5-phosphoribosyl)-5-[(5-phosphoribosylamino)methylideneamino]imidazole-4-carboxamide isomerase [Hyphomicrobiales bacterium]